MTESTATEQPAGTLNDDLNDAFSDFDDDMQPIIDQNESVDEPEEEPTDEDPTDEELTDIEEESEESEEEVEDPLSEIESPKHWTKKDKEVFDNAPPELKQWMLDRHASMEKSYYTKTQEIAEIRKEWEPVDQMFAPYKDQLRASGQSPASVIQHWAQVDQAMKQNPQQTIQWLAQQHGVQLGESQDDTFVDPKVQSLEQQLIGLQQQIQQREQYEYTQRNEQAIQEIQSFADEKTEAGELAHPYFEEVMDDMKRLAEAERFAGNTPNLGKLYETAVWANPEVRERMLASQREAEAKKAEKEAKAKAARAKKAQKTIRSSPDGDSVSELSLRDELEQSLFG